MTYSVTLTTLLSVLALSAAPRSAIEPAQPKWGDPIQLVYHSDAAGAKLRRQDAVMALLTIWYPETIEQRRIPMRTVGAGLRAEFSVPPGAAFLSCYFVTNDRYEGPATSMIWGADGNPARGAWHASMTEPYLAKDYRERAAKELALYPDDWSVYRDIWFLSARDADRDDTIRRDMALISRDAKDRPVTALYALTYGYLLLGQESAARAVLSEMLHRFPDELLTYWSISSYEYEAQVRHFAGEGPTEVRAWHLEFLRRNAGTTQARSDVDSAGSDSIPTETIEAICRPWVAEDPRNPKPYIALAGAVRRDPARRSEALRMTETALTLLLEGELRLHGDISGKMTEFLLPALFQSASTLALGQNQPLAALAYAKTAQIIGPQIRPENDEAEAAVWESLGHPALARAARKRIGQQPDSARMAPPFQTASLDGSPIDSAQLRGRIIVANFWFTGCGPCKAEIPDLNQLTADFAGKGVIFLGFTLDDDPAVLHRFLKEYPFRYTIVPNADKIAGQFAIKTYPSHIIIGPDGRIQSMLEGGGVNSVASLRKVLQRLLE